MSVRTGLVRAGVGVSAVALALAVALFGASAAQAHNVLRGTDPADGATVATAPAQVTLTFDEPALALGTEIEVRSPDGTLVSDGDAVLVDSTVSEKLAGSLPAGRYTVEWRVTSADGHPITGGFSFTTTTATTAGDPVGPSASPNPGASDAATGKSEGARVGGGGAVVLVVVMVAVVAGWLLWRRRLAPGR